MWVKEALEPWWMFKLKNVMIMIPNPNRRQSKDMLSMNKKPFEKSIQMRNPVDTSANKKKSRKSNANL